jgi:hypothetical protein
MRVAVLFLFPALLPAADTLVLRVLHPYPMERFTATHPRWEPYA